MLLLTNAERASGFFPEHTMVDGVLHLTDELSELRPLRHIRVLKLRGSAPMPRTAFRSDHGQGPRGPAQNRDPISRSGVRRTASLRAAEALRSECPSSTRMLRGGVRHGSITMLIGIVRQRQDAARDAVPVGGRQARRTSAVYFGFYEHPAAILAKCQRVGIGGLARGRRARSRANRLASADRRRDRRTRREPD